MTNLEKAQEIAEDNGGVKKCFIKNKRVMIDTKKAKEIRAYITNAMMADGKTKGLDMLSFTNKTQADLINIYDMIERAAMIAMQWKDEQAVKAFCKICTTRECEDYETDTCNWKEYFEKGTEIMTQQERMYIIAQLRDAISQLKLANIDPDDYAETYGNDKMQEYMQSHYNKGMRMLADLQQELMKGDKQ